MADLLERIEIDPDGEPTGTVIWLHGLGASGHDFEPIVPMLGTPRVRYVFPHAPERAVTINAGWVMPAWYDIRSLEEGADREDLADVERAAEQIRALVAHEVDRGVSTDRIVLAGFSQGGAMALHVAARLPDSLRGIMILSGYLLAPDRFADEATDANGGAPMLFCHGTLDDVVPLARGRRAYQAAAALSADRGIEWHEYAMGHEVCPEEIDVIGGWLRERFP